MTYDAMGRMQSIRYGDGQYWSYTYDGAGSLASSTNAGNQTRYEYDKAGRLTRVIQPLGNGPRYTYNLAGELVRSEGGPEGVRRTEYDAHGRVRAEYDGNGRARRYGYDSAGRLVRMTNEMGQTVSYGYDGAGNRVSLMDANLNVSTFEYDRDGNLLALRYPDVPGASANVERYEYDAAGRLAVKTTPNGVAIRFLYDMAGKPLAVYTGEAVSTPGDVPGERLVVRYEYNGAGQVVREENRGSLLTYAYDAFGRLSRVDYPNLGRWVTYDYGLDRPTRVSVYDRSYDTSLSVYDYVLAYNASGEVASARNRGGAYYGHYAYDENGRRAMRTLGNGTVNAYEYDDNDRLKQLSITHDGEVLASFRYSHDGAGNRTGIEYGDGSRSVYEYDEAYRLIRDLRVDARGGTLYDESYAYDAVGNRLRKTRLGGRNPVDVAYAYNARNQIVSVTGDEAGEYEYDRDGNLIRTAGPHGVETREYDVLGRLTGYAGPGGTERYTHIGADWKRQTAIYTPTDGEEEKYTFLYDGDNVLMDLEGDSLTLRNTYVTPFLDESLVMIRAGEGADHYYMSHDGLGSVRVLNSGQGHLRNVYDYTAYGEPDPVSTFNGPVVTHQRYGYTGREVNGVSGDLYYRFRNYHSKTGRFSKRDPIGYVGGMNQYAYVENMPYSYFDPFGLKLRVTGNADFRKRVFDALNELCSGLKMDSMGNITMPYCPVPSDGLCAEWYDIIHNNWNNIIRSTNDNDENPATTFSNKDGYRDEKGNPRPGSAFEINIGDGLRIDGPRAYDVPATIVPPWPIVLAHELGHGALMNKGIHPFGLPDSEHHSMRRENDAWAKFDKRYVRKAY